MNNGTLTRRLFMRIAPTTLLAIACVGALAFYSATQEVDYEYDAQLISNANVLWTLIEDELREPPQDFPKKIEDIDIDVNGKTELNDTADEYADSRMFRIWQAKEIIMHSDTAMPDSVAKRSLGFSVIDYDNEEWVIYNLPIPRTNISIEVGEKTK